MDLHAYRYGEGTHLDGFCVGVARYPPRGVRRELWATKGFFDVWLPQLAPSRELVAAFRRKTISFQTFATGYRREMRHPDARHLITFLAAVARSQRVNLGCFCADATRCHRSILHELIGKNTSVIRSHLRKRRTANLPVRECASSPCSMPEVSD